MKSTVRPVIGITSNEDVHESWAPKQFGQNTTYVEAVIRSGGVPVILPQTDDTGVLDSIYDLADGFLLAGGEDLGARPSLRDSTEYFLAGRCIEDGKPLLGICRGMHVINHVLGGGLYDDIATDIPGALGHNDSRAAKDISHVARTMRLDQRSRLSAYLQVPEIGINEYHHQAINRLGEGLRAVGWTKDGIIEALEGTGESFLIGVQCHPESLLLAPDAPWSRLFTRFVACSIGVELAA